MIGLDTTVILRFLVQDDADQAAAATAVFSGLSEVEPGFVSREVQVELVWVLERACKYDRADIARAFEGMLGARELVLEAQDRKAAKVPEIRVLAAGPGH